MDPLGAFSYFQSKGWTPAQSAGIVGNLHYESAGWNAAAVGDNGTAYGLAQWRGDRQTTFAQVIGRPLKGSSVEQQLAFVDWELRNTNREAGNRLRQANTVEQATYSFAKFYERPKNLSSVGARTTVARGLLAKGKGLVAGALENLGGSLRTAANSNPYTAAAVGATDALGITSECGVFCQFKNWVTDSGFFQRLALAVFAFIMLFAAFYMMKGDVVSQLLPKARKA